MEQSSPKGVNMNAGQRVIVNGKPAVIVYRGNDNHVIVRQDGKDFAVGIYGLKRWSAS